MEGLEGLAEEAGFFVDLRGGEGAVRLEEVERRGGERRGEFVEGFGGD